MLISHICKPMTDRSSHNEREISIFWDYENVPLPLHVKPAEAAKAIQSAVSQYGRRIEMRRVYFDPYKTSRPRDPSGLDSSGFDLVHTPARNMKETLDKKLIVDVLAFAWDCSSKGREPCVVLITSDGDYAYTLSKLRDRGVMNVVMYGPECTADVLIANAEVALSFENQVLAPAMAPPPPPPPVVVPAHIADQTAATCTNRRERGRTGPNRPAAPGPDTNQVATTASNRRVLRKASSGRSAGSNRDGSDRSIEQQSAPSTENVQSKPGDIDKDVVSFCQCLLDKQKKWEKGLGVSYELSFIPAKIMQDSFQAIPGHRSILACKDARDASINKGLVEAARKDLGNKKDYVDVSLGEGAMRSNLSREFFLRLTGKGREFLEKIEFGQVRAYCSLLYQKQKDWEYGNRVKYGLCWIPSKVMQKEFEPLFPPIDRSEYNQLCKDTRDRAISDGFIETARRNQDNREYVPVPLGEKVALDGLSKEFFLRLTAGGRQLAEVLLARGTNNKQVSNDL